MPRGTDFASVFVSDRRVVIQHTHLDSRQAELPLLSTNRLGRGLSAVRRTFLV